jgi:hypothetical protein
MNGLAEKGRKRTAVIQQTRVIAAILDCLTRQEQPPNSLRLDSPLAWANLVKNEPQF